MQRSLGLWQATGSLRKSPCPCPSSFSYPSSSDTSSVLPLLTPFSFLVSQFFPILNDKLGKGITYFIFAGLGLLFLVSVGWFVPETRGKKGMADVWGYDEQREGHED